MKKLIFILFTLLLTTALHAQHHHGNGDELGATEINAEHSVYHLEAEWTDHRGDTYSLRDFSGKPVIVVMFYGNCAQVCPVLIEDARRLYSAVDRTKQDSVRVLAITFDVENDTPEVLRAYAEKEQLNIPGWHFMRSEAASVRTLATMLGVQYAEKSDGHFAHSNLLTVLDKKGRIARRVEGLFQQVDEAASEINAIIQEGKSQ